MTSTAPPRTRLSREARRQQILDTAARLLNDEGPAAITMERIAAEANVTKPIVYSHFANSTELLLSLLETAWTRLDEHISQISTRRGTPFAERLAAVQDAYFAALGERGPILQRMVSTPSIDPVVEERRTERRRKLIESWAGWTARELDIPLELARVVSRMLTEAVTGAASSWLDGTVSRERAQEMARVAALAVADAITREYGGSAGEKPSPS